MFVKAKKDHADYGPEIRIFKDNLYIVYAIEANDKGTSYFALSAGFMPDENSEPNPLFFPADIFEILEDRVSKDWLTKKIQSWDGEDTYSSFPEWFENNFYIRGHDWDFEDDDYVIMRKYITQYREVYKDLIAKGRYVNPDENKG